MLFELPDKEEIEDQGIKAIRTTSLDDLGWKEKDLENLLANNITQMIRDEYLLPIHQERQGQPEPDIMAVDEEGKLYIFELKRAESKVENVLQVMRYGQNFGAYTYQELNDMFKGYMEEKIGFQNYHKERFGLKEPLPKNEFNQNQKFVIVTDAVDVDTLRAINYWNEKGLDLDALPYRIYRIGNKQMIDFNPYGPETELEMAERNSYVVNTNADHIEPGEREDYKEMLTKNKASAYGSSKEAIDEIEGGDRILLYHNKVGVCATGIATDGVEEKDYLGRDGFEHYVPCHYKKKIDPVKNPDKALKHGEIKEKSGIHLPVRGTVNEIKDYQKAKTVEQLFLEKQRKLEEEEE